MLFFEGHESGWEIEIYPGVLSDNASDRPQFRFQLSHRWEIQRNRKAVPVLFLLPEASRQGAGDPGEHKGQLLQILALHGHDRQDPDRHLQETVL